MANMRNKASRFFAISVFIIVMSGADPEPNIDEGDVQTLSGGHVIDAEGRKLLPKDMSRMLERLDHDELVQLLHRAGARAHVMAHVRDQFIAGIDLAASSSYGEMLNCSADDACFLPSCNAFSAPTNPPPMNEFENPSAPPNAPLVSHSCAPPDTPDKTASHSGVTCGLVTPSESAATPRPPRGVDSAQRETAGGEQVAEERQRERERDREDPRESLSQVAAAAHLVNKKLLEYARWHAHARRELLREGGSPSAKNRFLVWTCGSGTSAGVSEHCSGWGNRLLGIVSGLMLAILSDRAFLIHWPDDSCAALSDHLGSEWIDWRMPPGLRSRLSPLDQEFLVNHEPRTGLEMSALFRTLDPRTLAAAKPLIWLRASHGLFIDLWRNAHVSPLLCAYGFATVDHAFARLARFLLSAPQGELKRAVASALAGERLAGKFIIGLQLRFTEVSRLSMEDVQRFYKAAVAIETHAHVRHDHSAWVIATDSDEIRKVILAGPYRDKVFFFAGPIGHLDHQHEKGSAVCSTRSQLKMYLDWWLLREADALVASGDSTFGVTAHMLRFEEEHTRRACSSTRARAPLHMRAVMNCHAAERNEYGKIRTSHGDSSAPARAAAAADERDDGEGGGREGGGGEGGGAATAATPHAPPAGACTCRADDEAYVCGAPDVCFNGLYGFTLSEHVECLDSSLDYSICARAAPAEEDTDTSDAGAAAGAHTRFLYCADEGEYCWCEAGVVRYGTENVFRDVELPPDAEGIECSSPQFGGDPAPEQEKLCQCRQEEAGEDHAAVRGEGVREGEETEELVASEPLVDWQATSLQAGGGGESRRGAAALQVLRPSEAEPYVADGDIWQTNLVFIIRGVGVGDLETCQLSFFSSWMLLGQWSLNQLKGGSCEFAGRMCYPKGASRTSQTAEHETCFNAAGDGAEGDTPTDALFCTVSYPDHAQDRAFQLEFALRCHHLDVWENLPPFYVKK